MATKDYTADITICIPTKNNLPTIKLILNALNYQDIYPKIIVFDNGSIDGTLEAMQTMIKNKVLGDLDVELIDFGEWTGIREQNLDKMRYELSQMVKTKYLMFIDADVLIPPYVIIPMLDQMEKDVNIGMLGLKYDVMAEHVKIGASILRTNLTQGIVWNRENNKCNCLCAIEYMQLRGFKAEHFPTTARHLLAF